MTTTECVHEGDRRIAGVGTGYVDFECVDCRALLPSVLTADLTDIQQREVAEFTMGILSIFGDPPLMTDEEADD